MCSGCEAQSRKWPIGGMLTSPLKNSCDRCDLTEGCRGDERSGDEAGPGPDDRYGDVVWGDSSGVMRSGSIFAAGDSWRSLRRMLTFQPRSRVDERATEAAPLVISPGGAGAEPEVVRARQVAIISLTELTGDLGFGGGAACATRVGAERPDLAVLASR